MATINIAKDELLARGLPYSGYDDVEIISDTVTDVSRWSIHSDIIFRWIDGKVYKTSYSVGATEMQSEEPWEYEDDVECTEVVARERVVQVWEAV